MRREFLIERQGKVFALYSGLLDEAHQNGLKSIRTRLLQAPSKENGDTTIVLAEVEMQDGRVFCGLGDASPSNVGRNIAAHAPRMAETRAKARALRDAINVGTVSIEELGDEEEHSPPPRQQPVKHDTTPIPAGREPTPLRQPSPPPRPVRGGQPGETSENAVKAQTPHQPADTHAAWRAKADELHATITRLEQFKNAPQAPPNFDVAQLKLYVSQWEPRLAAATRNGAKAGA